MFAPTDIVQFVVLFLLLVLILMGPAVRRRYRRLKEKDKLEKAEKYLATHRRRARNVSIAGFLAICPAIFVHAPLTWVLSAALILLSAYLFRASSRYGKE